MTNMLQLLTAALLQINPTPRRSSSPSSRPPIHRPTNTHFALQAEWQDSLPPV